MQWRASIIKAADPRAAVLAAKRNTLKSHPGATEMEEFMQRKISEERAEEIADLMRANEWHGWAEHEEH